MGNASDVLQTIEREDDVTTSVLFVSGKAPVVARMAEALLRHMGGREFAVAAEGDAPLTQEALDALARHGVHEAGTLTDPTASAGTQPWDYVISIGGPPEPSAQASHHETWSVPLPDSETGYAEIAAQLHDHIRQFMDHSGQESIRPLGVD